MRLQTLQVATQEPGFPGFPTDPGFNSRRDAVFRVLAVEQPQAVVLNYAPGFGQYILINC